jgi:hypothetical protein
VKQTIYPIHWRDAPRNLQPETGSFHPTRY